MLDFPWDFSFQLPNHSSSFSHACWMCETLWVYVFIFAIRSSVGPSVRLLIAFILFLFWCSRWFFFLSSGFWLVTTLFHFFPLRFLLIWSFTFVVCLVLQCSHHKFAFHSKRHQDSLCVWCTTVYNVLYIHIFCLLDILPFLVWRDEFFPLACNVYVMYLWSIWKRPLQIRQTNRMNAKIIHSKGIYTWLTNDK